ncbi:MAG: hypothetical protein ACREQI_02815 [Candidatus Binataceae bacterium]
MGPLEGFGFAAPERADRPRQLIGWLALPNQVRQTRSDKAVWMHDGSG